MTARSRVVVVGAGGLGREAAGLIRDIAASGGSLEFVGFVVSDLSRLGPRDSEVLGDYEWLAAHAGEVDALALGIGNPLARLAVGDELTAAFPRLDWPVLVHPSVHLDRSTARLGRGSVMAAGTVATVNVTLEELALVNISCTLGHETRIGRGSVVNPGVNISGGVHVGAGVLVGTGAKILQYVAIGDRAVVGAGAVVLHDVAEATTVVGVPARPRASKTS